MSETSHGEEVHIDAHAKKEVANPNYNLPKSIPVLIVLVILAMFSPLLLNWSPTYGVYRKVVDRFDYKTPETVVQSYFDQVSEGKDFDRAVDKLSVFLVVSSLPEYSSYQPSQLLQARPEIIHKAAQLLKETYKESPQPVMQVKPLPDYTKTGEVSALVVFKVMVENKDEGMGMAYLIKEEGKYRIIGFQPITAAALDEVKKIDMKIIDEQAKSLFSLQ